MDLSIIIPGFNESRKIARDIEMAGAFLNANFDQAEIIIVDDGSSDKTAEIAEKTRVPQDVHLEVVRCESHRGKGYAVRTGMSRSKGDYVMFADSGLCVPFGNALLGMELLQADKCDIAHGSRKLIQSDIHRNQPWYRRICSRLFKWFVHKMMNIPPELSDTQCGFKVYKGAVARELYAECVTDGFMFDVEIIIRALKQGLRIREFPIEWVCDLDSRLSLAKTPWPVLRELLRLKRMLEKNGLKIKGD